MGYVTWAMGYVLKSTNHKSHSTNPKIRRQEWLLC